MLHGNRTLPLPPHFQPDVHWLPNKGKKIQKNLQFVVIDLALIWQCFSMPCSLHDSIVYVTANGAHTDELSVAHTRTNTHTHTKTLVVKSTHRHLCPTPTACTVRMSRLILKSWRGRRRVRLEDQKGNSVLLCRLSAEQHPPYAERRLGGSGRVTYRHEWYKYVTASTRNKASWPPHVKVLICCYAPVHWRLLIDMVTLVRSMYHVGLYAL